LAKPASKLGEVESKCEISSEKGDQINGFALKKVLYSAGLGNYSARQLHKEIHHSQN
jgi:hypothetical protein